MLQSEVLSMHSAHLCLFPFRRSLRAFSSSRTLKTPHICWCSALEHSRASHDSDAQRAHSRRHMLFTAASASTLMAAYPASAIGFKKELKKRSRNVGGEGYTEGYGGLKQLDLSEGSGPAVQQGDGVTVHFDCIFKGIDVASSRAARLLGGNRTVSEPLTFTAGKKVMMQEKQAGESAGGLFSGQSGPKPPPALSKAVIGMKQGGKRSVLVPPEQGYGSQGLLEIPPDATFELRIEVLSIGGQDDS